MLMATVPSVSGSVPGLLADGFRASLCCGVWPSQEMGWFRSLEGGCRLNAGPWRPSARGGEQTTGLGAARRGP